MKEDFVEFNPEIQRRIEDAIVMIRMGESDTAINTLQRMLEIKKDELALNEEVPVTHQFFRTCIGMIKKNAYPFNVWLKIIMGSWFLDWLKNKNITEDIFNKFLSDIGADSKEDLIRELSSMRISVGKK